MSEGNVYEAASEVRDAVFRKGDQLAEELNGLALAVEQTFRRRDRWAGELFAELVVMATRSGVKVFGVGAEDGRKLAATAWELADILEAADPRRTKTPAAPPADDAEGGGIDLSQTFDPPSIDDVYGGPK